MAIKKYTLVIEETVTQEFEVEAESSEKSIEIAVLKYQKGDFVLVPGEVSFN